MIQQTFYSTNAARPELGVSPLSWVNEVLLDLGGDTRPEQCLHEASQAGYQGVEMSRILPRSAEALIPLLNQHQLRLISGWYDGFLTERSVEAELQAVHQHASLLSHCGAKVMVYGECGWMAERALDIPLSQRRLLPADRLAAYADRLSRFAAQLYARYGLRLAYHHHLMMVAETWDEIARLLNACSSEVGLLLDTGHAFAAGFSYQQLIERFPERICHIHLKDVRRDRLQQARAGEMTFNEAVLAGLFCAPGEGDLDFAPLARFIAASGYSGWLVVEAEQDPAKAPPLATVTRAHHYVTRHILPQESLA